MSQKMTPGRYLFTRMSDGKKKTSLIEILEAGSPRRQLWRYAGEASVYPFAVCEGEKYERVVEAYEAAEPPPDLELGTTLEQLHADAPGELFGDREPYAKTTLGRRADCAPTPEFLAAVAAGNTEGLASRPDDVPETFIGAAIKAHLGEGPDAPLKWREVVALTTFAATQRTRHNELNEVACRAFDSLRRIHNEALCELRIPEDRTDLRATMQKLRAFLFDDEP